jgi:hypothetical protein
MRLKCNRCRKLFTGKDEYDAEMKFNMHECKVDGRTLDELTDHELMLIITGEKTENEVWNDRVKGA